MRKITLFSILVVFATLLYNCQPKKDQQTVAFNPSQAAGGKIVYVNIDTLLDKYNLYKDNKKQLEDDYKKAEGAIAGKLESFQKRVADFQRKVYETQQKAQDIAPVELQKLEADFGAQQKRLGEEEQSLMKQRESSAGELEKKLADLQKNLKNKIDEYLEKISAERGYDYVLMKGAGYSVLYGNKGLDITTETINAVNEIYAKEKK